MLTRHDTECYAQHICLDNIGQSGQLKLKKAKVLCIGLGGLGTPVCLYLAKAGIGTIGLVDGDSIECSNLPRQILYSENDIGRYKVDVCAEQLQRITPDCRVHIHQEYLSQANALTIINDYDMVIDCCDNFATRYLINDACCQLNKINISASIFKYNAMLCIFPGNSGPCYRCLFENFSEFHKPNCSEAGVLNTFAGFIALLQAHETVKSILQLNYTDMSKVLTIDGLSMRIHCLNLNKNLHCVACAQKTDFFDLERPTYHKVMCADSISYHEYLALRKVDSAILLIDVRNPDEFAQYHLATAINMPLDTIKDTLSILDKQATIVLYCQTGKRSLLAKQQLSSYGFNNVLDIYGGLAEVDIHMNKCDHEKI